MFYQKYWDIVAEDICKFCLHVLNERVSMDAVNKTYIVVIPKVKDPKSMKDFRPISLCTVLYKIIVKSLANRLKLVLERIISPSQSTFIPRRLITDNACFLKPLIKIAGTSRQF